MLWGEALVWPASDGALSARLGYTTSAGIYLPAEAAEGMTVAVDSGSASVYAGLPAASSHYFVGSISPGSPLVLTGLGFGEVVSVQGDATFEYTITPPAEPDPPAPPSEPSEEDGTAPSSFVTWTCTDTPCPWGSPFTGQALAWSDAAAQSDRLGYTASEGVYLPASAASGLTVWLTSGTATAYAGLPAATSHRSLGDITPESPLEISGLASGEVVSVQSSSAFAYGIIEAPQPPPEEPQDPEDPPAPTSQAVTWSCTSSPCPWGSSVSGQALVWPLEDNALSQRLGYATSEGVYLPAEAANGLIISVDSGSAVAYAGLPDASFHSSLATITPGAPYQVSGLAAGEVLSVQDSSVFSYELTAGELPEEEPEDPPVDPEAPLSSEWVTLNCTSSPCPWGSSLSNEAIAWPASANPNDQRLGYTVSDGIYLPAAVANGTLVTIVSGSATAYAGAPDAPSHRVLGSIGAGETFEASGLAPGEGLSVQSSGWFSYELTLGDGTAPPPEEEPEDPPADGVIESVPGVWVCNADDCDSVNWYTEVLVWPEWAAYQDNARTGNNAKAVYSPGGEPLYPYMGSWADGCEVTAVSGTVLIIEWERGTDVWRETWLGAGDTYTIDLLWPEDGAMIESFDYSPGFSVMLNNCEPQPLP